MKNKVLLILCMLLISLLIITGCGEKTDDNKSTKEPTTVPTVAVTEVPTPSPTPKPTIAPISEDQKGVPQKNAIVLFEDKFDDDDIEDDFFLLQGDYIAIEDGKLNLLENWVALAPIVDYALGVDHSQYELELIYQVAEIAENNPWISLFVGCRGPIGGNPVIATENGMFWVAFNGSTKAYIYPGGSGNYKDGGAWNTKYFEIDLPEAFVDKAHKITVVDCGDVICYYMNTESEEQYLIVKVLFEGDELICYGNDGTEIWREENLLADEGSFTLFNHYAQTLIEDIVVKGLK